MAGGWHALLDRSATVSGLFMRDRAKYFSESVESVPLARHLDEVVIRPPQLEGEGRHELPTRTLVGELDPACWVYRWVGPDAPSLVVHHGNNERPFDLGRTAKNMLGKALVLPEPPEVNLVLLRAAFHAGGLKQYLAAVRSLDRFAAMIAASAASAEVVIQALRAQGSPHVALTGLSLGGWVTNLHRAHLGTADVYVPICAGAALDEVFTSSAYWRLTSRRGLGRPEALRDTLNFEAEFAAAAGPVFPLLARYDQYIDQGRQAPCYGDAEVVVLDKGHVTAGLDAAALRRHVLAHTTRCPEAPTGAGGTVV
jgi:hypothetical protein